MTDFDQLSDKLQKRCGERETKFGKLTSSLTISTDGELFFLTNIFKDGSFLGFWTHSPCSTCHDQEQGWAVFSPKLEMLSSCETKTSGRPAGNDFMKWRKEQTEKHGKSKKLMPEWGGDQFWRITDC